MLEYYSSQKTFRLQRVNSENMMTKRQDRLPITDLTLFLIFLTIFELTSTIYRLPMNSVLRWVACFVLVAYDVFYAVVKCGGKFRLLPNEFAFLIFPLFIQSFWSLERMAVALSRSFSFILYCMAIVSLFHRPYMNSDRIRKVFHVFFIVSVVIILPLNLLQIDRKWGSYIGIYGNQNTTVSVLLSIFVILGMVVHFRKGLGKFKKTALIGLLLIDTYLIFTTHSRMAIIGTATALVLMLYLSSTQRNSLRTVVITGAIVAFIVMLPSIGQRFGIVSINRIFAPASADGSTGLVRNGLWDSAFCLFQQHPVFGWGNNATYYYTFVSPAGLAWSAHNSYLVMLIEGGLVGFAFYVLFFVTMARRCWRDYKVCVNCGMDNDSIILVRYCMITCIVLAVNAVSESFLFSAGNTMTFPFWFCLLGGRIFLNRKRMELENVKA